MLRKEVEAMKRKYRFDRFDIGSKCEPHTRKWILLLIFAIEMVIIFLLLNKIDAFFARYDWAKTGAFVILSLPIAFYLWMWRNHDKSTELMQKEIELKEAKRNAELAFFNLCMDKIIDKTLPTEIRESYLTSFLPYIRGDNGLEYELQALTFINGILKSNDRSHYVIIKNFSKSFNWFIQNGMFLFHEFHDMTLNYFSFSGISTGSALFCNSSMVSCHFYGNYNKAMFIACDLSQSIFRGCDFTGTILTGCNLSETTFCECNIPGSLLLSKNNISSAVFVNSDIVIPDDFPEMTEKITIVCTPDKKEKTMALKSKFPNAVYEETQDLSSIYRSFDSRPKL